MKVSSQIPEVRVSDGSAFQKRRITHQGSHKQVKSLNCHDVLALDGLDPFDALIPLALLHVSLPSWMAVSTNTSSDHCRGLPSRTGCMRHRPSVRVILTES